MSKRLLIRGGRLICPDQGIDEVGDLLIADGVIQSIGHSDEPADEVLDAAGQIVAPGLIDMHVHLREPGRGEEETIASGVEAAVAGGFTAVVAMPNTDPPVDGAAGAEFVSLQAQRAGKAHVYPVGTVTKGRKGTELAEIAELHRGGVVALSDDGNPIGSAQILRLALEYAKMFDLPIIEHCEDKELSGLGVMHEGFVSTVLGLPGIPGVSEEIIVGRDLALAELTGSRLHIAHVSSAGSVELIRQAKARGVSVTAEVTPHHLTLTDECVRTFDANFKMNPPLRTETDRQALIAGLQDGTLDAIASDHAPHRPEEKDVEFTAAPFGVIGLESTLPVVIQELIQTGVLTWSQAIEKLSPAPARILGLPGGSLRPGSPADVTVIDPEVDWNLDVTKFRSKSRNCPFHEKAVKGHAVAVLVAGKMVFRA